MMFVKYKIMLKAYKYRIKPTDEQKTLINKHLGSCGWLYNYAFNKMGLYSKNYSGTGCSGELLESSTLVGTMKEENILTLMYNSEIK